jgi:hypothetical protein
VAKKSKKTDSTEDPLEKYFIVYEDDEDEDMLMLALGFNYKAATRILTKYIIKLCAYQLVEDDKKYQSRFRELAGREVTRADMENWLLAFLVSDTEIALVTNLPGKGEPSFSIQGFPKAFASELTQITEEDQESQDHIKLVFQELDKIAGANPIEITQAAKKLLNTAVKTLKGNIYFRAQALIIQLLSDGLAKAFPHPISPEIVKQVETGLLPSLKAELLGTRGKGKPRGSGRRYDNKDQFKDNLLAAFDSLKRQNKKITQESVSAFLGCDDGQLRAWLKEFGLKWKEVKPEE